MACATRSIPGCAYNTNPPHSYNFNPPPGRRFPPLPPQVASCQKQAGWGLLRPPPATCARRLPHRDRGRPGGPPLCERVPGSIATGPVDQGTTSSPARRPPGLAGGGGLRDNLSARCGAGAAAGGCLVPGRPSCHPNRGRGRSGRGSRGGSTHRQGTAASRWVCPVLGGGAGECLTFHVSRFKSKNSGGTCFTR